MKPESKILFMLTLYNDHGQALKMIDTLSQCVLPGDMDGAKGEGLTGLIILDSSERYQAADLGLTRMMLKRVRRYCEWQKHFGKRVGLPEALNHAIDLAIANKFDYVSWIHPDMDFSYDPTWVSTCLDHLDEVELCGKVSPLEFKTDSALKAHQERGDMGVHVTGNACPWIMRVEDCVELKDLAGYVFDPMYHLMHYEDWDLINRVVTELSKEAHIIHAAQVLHEGMGTRKHFDYEDSLKTNWDYYFRKWGGMKGHL